MLTSKGADSFHLTTDLEVYPSKTTDVINIFHGASSTAHFVGLQSCLAQWACECNPMEI